MAEAQVELGLRGAGEVPERGDLADAERVWVAVGLEVGGGGADPVVEVGEGERVADDVELAGAGVRGRVGVVQGHVPGGLVVSSRVACFRQALGDGLGDGAVEGDPHGVTCSRGASARSTCAAAFMVRET